MNDVVRGYGVKSVVGYVVVASAISLLVQGMYREFTNALMRLMLTRDYSYLLVVSFTVVVVTYLLLKHISFTYDIQLSRVVASILFVVTAITLYYTSRINLEYSLQVLGLSFFAAISSLMLIALKFTSLGDIALLVMPLLLIPIPADLLDAVTLTTSRIIGRLTSLLTSVELIESPSLTLIRIVAGDGVHTFSVESICSGVITLSSVIAVVPLLTYYAKAVHERTSRKLVVSLLTLLTGLAVGFLGSLTRVVLIVLVAKYYGVDLALSVLQYLPSAVYAVTSVFIAYMMVARLSNIRNVVPKPSVGDADSSEFRWERTAGAFMLIAVIALILQSLAIIVDERSSSLANGLVIRVDRFEDLIENPTKCLGSGVVILNSTYDEYLTTVVNSLATYNVSILVNGTNYVGFLDITDVLVRFHTLRLYVAMQGYSVVSSWSKEDGFRITYMLMERGYEKYLLAYTILPLKVVTQSSEYVLYVRLSLMKCYESIEDLSKLSNALLVALNVSSVRPSIIGNILPILSLTHVSILAILIIYISVIYLYSAVFRRKR